MPSRALLTEREREVLAGETGTEAYRATVRSRLRNRFREFEGDIELLAQHEPELYEQLRELAC